VKQQHRNSFLKEKKLYVKTTKHSASTLAQPQPQPNTNNKQQQTAATYIFRTIIKEIFSNTILSPFNLRFRIFLSISFQRSRNRKRGRNCSKLVFARLCSFCFAMLGFQGRRPLRRFLLVGGIIVTAICWRRSGRIRHVRHRISFVLFCCNNTQGV